MALELIGGAALSSFFGTLFQELSSILLPGVLGDINSELDKLKGKLLTVQTVLDDAETRRFTEPDVSHWLDVLRELAYDMDDIVDEMKTRRLELDQAAKSQDQVCALPTKKRKIDQVCGSVSAALDKATSWASQGANEVQFNIALKRDINKVLERLDEAVKEGNAFGFRRNSIGSRQTRLSPETSPSIDESEVYGRGTDKDKVIELLFPRDDQKNYSVVSIVGMGGLGKTTLAQLVFKDENVKKQFDLQSWACVSDVFDVAKVTKELIEYSTRDSCPNMSLAALQGRLENMVKGKRFLLVLDDIWTSKEWDLMKAPLNHCKKGSMILVTTRSHKVAEAMNSRTTYEIKELDHDHCWALFQNKAFGAVDADTNIDENLIELGKEIVKKCKGVPLAIKVLGAMLRGARQESWEAVLNNKLWYSENDEDQIFSALRLSYHYLPSPLKRCFEYFSLFPSDYRFHEKDLVSMWIGEGFVEAKQGRLLEDIGSQYFDELKKRCLIQNDNRIHDLLSNLACTLLGQFYCRPENDSKLCKSFARARHASIDGSFKQKVDFGLLSKAKGLRTFLFLESRRCRCQDLLDRLSEWRLLRVVNLRWAHISKVPRSIGSLKHLRYLNLSGDQSIKILPDALCELYNLQYLILDGCRKLENIPEDIGSLINLRHLNLGRTNILHLPNSICKLSNLNELDLSNCYRLCNLPRDIGELQKLRNLCIQGTQISNLPESVKLTSLQTLDRYPVGKESGRGIGELKDTKNLADEFVICCLENVDSVEEAVMANLKSKKNIKSLTFEWSFHVVARDDEAEVKVLEALEPHPTTLHSLSFISYSGDTFPKWMSTLTFSCLDRFEMSGLRRITVMADVELPLLKMLIILGCSKLRNVFMAAPKLKQLYLGSCQELTKLSLLSSLQDSNSNFSSPMDLPQVERLRIRGCPSLSIPHGLSHLTSLGALQIDYHCWSQLEAGVVVPSLSANGNSLPIPCLLPPNLTSIHTLGVLDFPQLPQDGFPTALRALHVHGCSSNVISLPKALQNLKLLSVQRWPHLASFPEALHNLASLTCLIIHYCPQLASFPEEGLPPMLTELRISDCPKLEARPDDRLPPNLKLLDIENCPKLEQQLQDEDKRDWLDLM